MTNTPNPMEHLIHKATLTLEETTSILSSLKETMVIEDFNDEDKILSIQLTLQYRLSCEDALSILLNLDHNLLYFLGIQPQQSAKMNIERFAYHVGNEDLKQILNILAILTGSLAKIAARYKQTHSSFALHEKKTQKHSVFSKELSKLLVKQKQFLEILHQLNLAIESLLKLEAQGPVLDHIAALRGPISQFHQAVMHGLEQSKHLYDEINKTPVLDHQLNALLEETKKVLHWMPNTYNPSHYHMRHFDHPTTTEQLEQRAAAKRLRPFFS